MHVRMSYVLIKEPIYLLTFTIRQVMRRNVPHLAVTAVLAMLRAKKRPRS